jgi:predicted metal-dependent hydrolase
MDVPQSETVALPGGFARVAWRRSSRARRISLRIDPRAGAVVVTLPPSAERGAGMALLATHAEWVADRIAALPGRVRFEPGAVVPLSGASHVIRHLPEMRGGAWAEAGTIWVTGTAEFLPRRVADFLRAEARRKLSRLATEKAALLGARIRRIAVKDTLTRWGSCAADGSLAFSWRLVMAPGFVQDYVVAHEVAHLRHMNHGPRFWAQVETLTPHRAEAVPWLRREGARLLRVG